MTRYKVITFLFIVFWFHLVPPGIDAQTPDRITEAGATDQSPLIDSLIKVVKLGDRAILVSFGADAVAAIKAQKGIIVVDTGLSTGLTAKYRQKIENEFRSHDFAYVIFTHGHADHIGGHSVFGDAALVSHANAPQETAARSRNPETARQRIEKIVEYTDSKLVEYEIHSAEWTNAFTQKTRYQYALNDSGWQTPFGEPDVTFTDSLQIDGGDIAIEMMYFGSCHSDSDILIYVPELKFLFTGDLLSRSGRPSLSDNCASDNAKWQRAIAWTEKRMPNIDTILSGHGESITAENLEYFIEVMLQECRVHPDYTP